MIDPGRYASRQTMVAELDARSMSLGPVELKGIVDNLALFFSFFLSFFLSVVDIEIDYSDSLQSRQHRYTLRY